MPFTTITSPVSLNRRADISLNNWSISVGGLFMPGISNTCRTSFFISSSVKLLSWLGTSFGGPLRLTSAVVFQLPENLITHIDHLHRCLLGRKVAHPVS